MDIKLVSWNVNGLRAAVGKGFARVVEDSAADCFCVQETKLQQGQISLELPGYETYWSYAQKKGYSGVATLSRKLPLSVTEGIGSPEHDAEGRCMTLEFDAFWLVNVYVPNSQGELRRLDYRLRWEDSLLAYMRRLDAVKPVVLCGDLNVARLDIDVRDPEPNRGTAGFSDQERQALGRLLKAGFTDTFRYLHPDVEKVYSWWSYQGMARRRNDGWRIDYFVVSDRLLPCVADASILTKVPGSDHCPVTLTLSL